MPQDIFGNRLLLLDDDPAIGRFVKRVAEKLGFEVTVTSEAASFIKRARSWHPTVIILDLQMPGADGVQVIRDLAADQCTSQVVLASGSDRKVLESVHSLGTARGLNMAGILEKPMDVETLRGLLARFEPVSTQALSHDLSHGITAGQLFLEYQPKLDLRSGGIVGAEALVRWDHPVYGIVPPEHFIVLAEETGLIHRVTDWVVASAANQAAVWLREGLGFELAVNISARDLEERDLPERLESHCLKSGIAPASIVLELTETGAMREAVQMMDVLVRLRLKGFGLAIDDFGTGYSSLVQLQKMPFGEIKIDRGFVMSMSTDRDSAVIARIVVELARHLGLKSIAEGVEEPVALRKLREMGCELAQGYFLSRPVAPSSIPDIARRSYSSL